MSWSLRLCCSSSAVWVPPGGVMLQAHENQTLILSCGFISLFLQLQPDAILILYNFSGQCSGEALITFPSEEIARQAVAERSNQPFYGQPVHLVFCN